MVRSGPLLTEAQWKKIALLLPKPPRQRKGGRLWIANCIATHNQNLKTV
jgi:hypothetical protein